ncbi:MAG TPA: DsbA family oxidoreductase [Hypericibacter adhaerens]|jgi:predicted DsbA family dithiol-disulfide isomerase|uniref:DSBA oxidoreductase n=1 Tax=Hypericibacter adhaerens TaxID=2602016 RepID=A0A5J6MXD6_9PROT|nr:DsbA family oxidoreductase [Hypericibacter adhaerens]QEX22189.1 DSBA oxidoreductase [Hypericibacter adhaerens]HWA45360.1 DsbA family oxidoreductase [Hypericibacter adhaerens]
MQLDIFSDTICPWCYVGKRRLERALKTRPQHDIAIAWRAFQLNPTMPPEGMDRRNYIESKFGSPERARRIHEAVATAGAGEGIAFAFDRIKRTPNTVLSHRLLRFSHRYERQSAVLDGLFRAYFEEGLDTSDLEVLRAIAAAAGLPEDEVNHFLQGAEEREMVLAEDQLARRQGINGVPCFIFNGRFALSGAQEPEALFQLFDLAREDDTERRQASYN